MKTEKLNRIRKILTNKFLIALIVFSIWMTFFDSNRIIDRMKEYRNMKQLELDKIYYETKIEQDSRRMKELRTDKENLEKFAREQYLMKRPNEDVFIIIEED